MIISALWRAGVIARTRFPHLMVAIPLRLQVGWTAKVTGGPGREGAVFLARWRARG
jgi:hypothetical protein